MGLGVPVAVPHPGADMLDRKTFLVKERVAFLKLVDTYDIFDAASSEQIGIAHENVGAFLKLLRLIINKRLLPTVVEVREREEGRVLLTIARRGLLRSEVTVTDHLEREIGRFKSKLFSMGGGFRAYDVHGREVADIKGDWKGWNFRFLAADGSELGMVTKKWAGIGKELFTSADNYVIALDQSRALPPNAAALLLAAGLAVDTVYKER
jgi:uncharacterized protein YxjI